MATTDVQLASSSEFEQWSSQQNVSKQQVNRNSNIAIKAAEKQAYVSVAREQKELYQQDVNMRKEFMGEMVGILKVLATGEIQTEENNISEIKEQISELQANITTVDQKFMPVMQALNSIQLSLLALKNKEPQ
jgi:hypothetical protein